MVEEQPTAQCPHCGYPAEIGEHAPECPNNASNLNESKNGESDAEKLDPEVDQNELRKYTREDKSEERQVVADERQFHVARNHAIVLELAPACDLYNAVCDEAEAAQRSLGDCCPSHRAAMARVRFEFPAQPVIWWDSRPAEA